MILRRHHDFTIIRRPPSTRSSGCCCVLAHDIAGDGFQQGIVERVAEVG
jgi:hypothetical protein